MTTFEKTHSHTVDGSIEDLTVPRDRIGLDQLSFSEKVRERIDEDFFRYSGESFSVEERYGEDEDSAFEEEQREAFLRAIYEDEYSDEYEILSCLRYEKPEDIFYFSD